MASALAAPENASALAALVGELQSRLQELEAGQRCFNEGYVTALDANWILTSGVLVVLMQLGFALLESGMVREENVIATYAKNILDFVLGVVVCGLGSYNLAYPDSEVPMMVITSKVEHHSQRQAFFWHLVFQATSATIVSGAMAERTSLSAYMLFSMFMSGIIFSLGVRLTWGGGALAQLSPPFHDFAGSGVVHLVGGAASLVGACLAGPRLGRWHPATETDFAPHNVPAILSGVLFLWVGWYGFNPGSTGGMHTVEQASVASNAFIATTFAASAGGVSVLVYSLARTRGHSFDILAFSNGILAGLVAITAGCDTIDPPWGLLVGAAAGLLYLAANSALEWLRVDDVVGATAVHMCGGAWGLLAVGLFCRNSGLLMGHGWKQLYSQAAGVFVLTALSASLSLVALGATRLLGFLRVSREEEVAGLDRKLGISAYMHRSKAMAECRGAAEVLRECDFTPGQALAALARLQDIIYRPFTPQAADNKLRGEVEDILDHFSFELGAESKYLSFCSHHKKDGGEVARVFVDALRRVLATSDRAEHRKALERVKVQNVSFFDANNLNDLSKLLQQVALSQNHVILLTRQVLTRPWVLAEIVKAYICGLNIICVLVEWPEKEKDQRAFRFPADLHAAIEGWREYCRAVKTPRSEVPLQRLLTRSEPAGGGGEGPPLDPPTAEGALMEPQWV